MYRNIPWGSIISSGKALAGPAAVFILALSLTCGPKPSPERRLPLAGIPVPFNLRAEAVNGKATLFWSVDRNAGMIISGYNIYISEAPDNRDTLGWTTTAQRAYNDFPYPGDTDGNINSESFAIVGLSNGKSYLALVRTVGPSGELSDASNVVFFEPVARGEFAIGADHLAGNGGFNFDDGIQVPGKDPGSDLYLYATREKVGLSSPNRLGAGLRKTEFLLRTAKEVSRETIVITEGDIIILKTTRGLATITIEEITGRYPHVTARISYEYRPGR